MENALWKGKQLFASEIADNYALEREIRKASGRKELRCPDSECRCPILKYCHGEKKEAFFAHINNEHCDYAIFDSENNQVMRFIRKKICDNFKARGYQVQTEIKLLAHHYTHLLFNFPDGKRIAVEIGTQRLSAKRIDLLAEQYKIYGVPVKWIVLGDADKPVRENQTYFVKRYALNESKNRDLMVVDWDCQTASQHKVDTNSYEYNEEKIHSNNYPDVYAEYGSLDDLVFEDGEITFAGFNERFNNRIGKKKRAFAKKVKQMELEYQKATEFEKLTEELPVKNAFANTALPILGNQQTQTPVKSYEERKREIIPFIDSESVTVKDSSGQRWVKCTQCGKIDTTANFGCYGGSGKDINMGICYNCSRKGRSNDGSL